ncbi:MAG: hypothetical protein AB7O97_19360 [Planctomycetota bacterium]
MTARRAARRLAGLLTLLTGAALAAQSRDSAPAPQPQRPAEPLARATERLHRSLATSAALQQAAFTARWGNAPKEPPPAGVPDGDAAGTDEVVPAAPPAARVVRLGLDGRQPAAGVAKGVWVGDALHLEIDDDELLLVGRDLLARDDTSDWVPRHGRFADGNEVTFLPDAPRLLRALQRLDLQVAHATVATLNDRPVEVLAVALTPEQVTELHWLGLLPIADENRQLLVQLLNGRIRGAGGAGAGARTPAVGPEATVDLALSIDPATLLVHRVQLRCSKRAQQFAAGGNQVLVVGGQFGAGVDDTDAEEDDADAPLEYRDGLPRRSRKGRAVVDLTIDLDRHGAAALPKVGGAAARLLEGR